MAAWEMPGRQQRDPLPQNRLLRSAPGQAQGVVARHPDQRDRQGQTWVEVVAGVAAALAVRAEERRERAHQRATRRLGEGVPGSGGTEG